MRSSGSIPAMRIRASGLRWGRKRPQTPARWRAPCALATAAALSAPASAIAQPAASDAALADALFQDGKALMNAGQYAQACPKLAESQRLAPASNTLLTLALCHQNQGRTASAWGEFTEAASIAQKERRDDRVKVAREHLKQLEPILSRLTITVAPTSASLQGLEVTRDGVFVGSAVWGTAVPLDPGEHVVEAWAPGKKRWTMTVQLAPNGGRQTVPVPPLVSGTGTAPAAAPVGALPDQPPASEPASSPMSSRKIAGFVVGGIGVAALAVGGVFGVRAITQSSEAKKLCPQTSCDNPKAVETNDSAKVSAIVSDIGLGAGIVGVGVGVFLLVTAPSSPAPKPSGITAAPWVGPGGAGVTVRSAF